MNDQQRTIYDVLHAIGWEIDYTEQNGENIHLSFFDGNKLYRKGIIKSDGNFVIVEALYDESSSILPDERI